MGLGWWQWLLPNHVLGWGWLLCHSLPYRYLRLGGRWLWLCLCLLAHSHCSEGQMLLSLSNCALGLMMLTLGHCTLRLGLQSLFH